MLSVAISPWRLSVAHGLGHAGESRVAFFRPTITIHDPGFGDTCGAATRAATTSTAATGNTGKANFYGTQYKGV